MDPHTKRPGFNAGSLMGEASKHHWFLGPKGTAHPCIYIYIYAIYILYIIIPSGVSPLGIEPSAITNKPTSSHRPVRSRDKPFACLVHRTGSSLWISGHEAIFTPSRGAEAPIFPLSGIPPVPPSPTDHAPCCRCLGGDLSPLTFRQELPDRRAGGRTLGRQGLLGRSAAWAEVLGAAGTALHCTQSLRLLKCVWANFNRASPSSMRAQTEQAARLSVL